MIPDPDADRVVSRSFCRTGRPGHADPDPVDTDHYQCQAHDKVDELYIFFFNVHQIT